MRSTFTARLPAPVTCAYLGVLTATTAVVRVGRWDGPVTRFASTNLHNLTHHPVLALVCSAFVVASPATASLLLIGVPLAIAEWALGVRRAVWGFVLGHVGATLLVAAGLAGGVAAGLVPEAVEHAPDVGVSYGAYGLMAAVAASARPRLAVALLTGEGVYLAGAAALFPSFTAVGHLCAFGVGVGYGLMLRRRRGRWHQLNHTPQA